jgi:CBS domain-containing protein
MRVADVMTTDIEMIDDSVSCHEAATRMLRAKVRHLPVVDPAGALAGILTDRDLRHGLLAPAMFGERRPTTLEDVLKSARVGDVMSTPVVTVAPGEDLATAARIMREHKIGSLPVVANGRVVGIVTETDLLRQLISEADWRRADVPAIVVSFP